MSRIYFYLFSAFVAFCMFACPAIAAELAKPVIFTHKVSGDTSTYPEGEIYLIHSEPSLSSPVLNESEVKKLGIKSLSELTNDEDSIVIHSFDTYKLMGTKYDKVDVTQGAVIFTDSSMILLGTEAEGASRKFTLHIGDEFESAADGLFQITGGDCIVRIHSTLMHVGVCPWTTGYSQEWQQNFTMPAHPDYGTSDYSMNEHISPAPNDQLWHRLVGSQGKVVGWILHDWDLGD